MFGGGRRPPPFGSFFGGDDFFGNDPFARDPFRQVLCWSTTEASTACIAV